VAQQKEMKATTVYWDQYEHGGRTFFAAMTDQGVVSTSLGNESADEFFNAVRKRLGQVEFVHAPEKLSACTKQLREYFAGNLQTFDLPLDLRGTDFQKAVWSVLSAIPFGKTLTYGDVARNIGNPKAVRAVGGACGANPVPIIVPCHRVIGSNGSLTGFGGGVDLKREMLKLEGVEM
jgi:methylated-DNA-[protein]-cysteine S-methyltransferase